MALPKRVGGAGEGAKVTNPTLNAARDYMAFGLAVIALSGKMPNAKHHPHGLHSAFTQADSLAEDVTRAFTDERTTGVGIVCNFPLIVVDIDGEEGAQAWKELAGDEFMPDSWVAKTGRGLHLYFASWQPTRTTKLGEKLDLKGQGGYVAAPPSLHPDGHRYEWIAHPFGPLPEAPQELTEHLEWKAERRSAAVEGRAYFPRRREQFEDGKWWALPSFDGLINTVREAPSGSRNEKLNWAAYNMAREGAGDEEFAELLGAATDSGLTEREAMTTIRSGIKSGRSER